MKNTRLFLFRDKSNELILFGVGLVSYVVMSFLMPDRFFTISNAHNMLFQAAELGILSLAMALTIIIAGIDLSVVSTANLTAIVIILFQRILPKSWLNIPSAFFLVIILGFVLGSINGLLVAKVKVSPILATLGTMTLYSGISIGITNGATIAGIPESMQTIGAGLFLAIPIPLYFFIFCSMIIAWILNRTPFGFKLYLLGNNPNVTRFSGYNNDRLTIVTYIISGILSALAGLIFLCRSNSAYADYGKSYITLTILIVVLGGVSVTGGRGRIGGIVLALLVMQVFSTGFNMLLLPFGNSNFFKDFLYGVLLISILMINPVLKNTKIVKKSRKNNKSENVFR